MIIGITLSSFLTDTECTRYKHYKTSSLLCMYYNTFRGGGTGAPSEPPPYNVVMPSGQRLTIEIIKDKINCDAKALSCINIKLAFVACSVRYGHWHKDKGQPTVKNVPRIIIFFVGGVSFSEIRCAYEVTAANKNWEVIIGKSR